ncbi:MAG: flagellar basal body P-ring formation chaperone FlgA [Phycisphaerales bacterium]
MSRAAMIRIVLASVAIALGGGAPPMLGATPIRGDARDDAGMTTIVMRSTGVAPVDGPVRLEDVAELSGPEAERLGQVSVSDAGRGAKGHGGRAGVTVQPADVRRALDEAGVNWAKVALRGVPCAVRAGARPVAAERSPPARERNVPVPVDLSGPRTVRTIVAERLAALYSVPAEDLRLRFAEHPGSAGAEERALLDLPAIAGRRIEAHPGSTASSGRVGIRVDVYAGDRVEASRTISVEALIRRSGCVASSSIERGQLIAREALADEERWISPGADVPIAMEAASGQTARRRIDAGRMLVASDVRPTISIQRGDEVVVHTLAGGMVLKSRARALGSAAEGELVELRRDGSRRSFVARAAAGGIAVVLLGEPVTSMERPASASAAEEGKP